jgi:hypothetical protein
MSPLLLTPSAAEDDLYLFAALIHATETHPTPIADMRPVLIITRTMPTTSNKGSPLATPRCTVSSVKRTSSWLGSG